MFATGLVMFLFGIFIVHHYVNQFEARWNAGEIIGAFMFYTGSGLMSASLLLLAWRWLP